MKASLTDLCSVSNEEPFNMLKGGKYAPSIHPLTHPCFHSATCLYQYGALERRCPLNECSGSAMHSLSDVWQVR